MDPVIDQTIAGLLSSFDYVDVRDPAVKAEIEQYKRDVRALGEGAADAGSFMTELQSSGLMAKQSDLMTRASTAPAAAADEAPAPAAGGLPSVRDFLEQYRPGYDAARAHGFQPSAVAAYEALFAVADRTDDLLTMHRILEEEGHLRAIAATALYDVNKLAFDATDPNNLGVRDQHRRLMELARSYRTDEELHYRTDLLTHENQQGAYRHNFMIRVAARLSLACVGYGLSKARARTSLTKYAGEFVAARDTVRAAYGAAVEIFDLDYDRMIADPWISHWLLNPQNLDSTGRVTKCLDVRNLDHFREVIFEEALSDLTDRQCLERQFERPFYPSLNVEHDPEQRQADEAIQRAGKERLRDKQYAGYEQKVGRG